MIPKHAEFLRAFTKLDQAPRQRLPSVAFAGRSNVGKSSLINTLLKKKGLARTSSTPGCTQEIVYFGVNGRYYFVDLPGYGFAKVPESVRRQWGPMIERFIESNDDLRAVMVLLDARRDPSAEDLGLVEWLRAIGRPRIFAVTKCDKIAPSKLTARLREIGTILAPAQGGEGVMIPFSAETGLGRIELLKEIGKALETPLAAAPESPT